MRLPACITLLLVVAFAALAGCGTSPPPKCQASNCAGCCSSTGECLTATKQSNSVCGTGVSGAACRTCPSGQACAPAQNKCVSAIVTDGGNTQNDAGACGFKGLPCCDDTTCDTGLTCARGYCSVDQTNLCGGLGQKCCSGSCYLPNSCTNNVCTAGPNDSGISDAGLYLKTTGEACAVGGECFDGTCLTNGFPQGVCTKACTTSSDCFAGSQCARNPTGSGPAKVCLQQCKNPGQAPGGCRPGYVCERNADTSGIPVCFPPCTASSCADAGVGATCDPTGFCCGANSLTCCGFSTGGTTCNNSVCNVSDGYCSATTCGGLGKQCCAGDVCNGQAVCNGGTCVVCGGVGQACCASGVCSDSKCVGNSCVKCGQPGQLCCDGNLCTTGSTCLGNSCFTCGALGQPCCDGATCAAGGVCGNGVCTAIGTACVQNSNCPGNVCITDPSGLRYEKGYCSQDCSAATCPLGSSCSGKVDSAGTFCYTNCVFDGGAGGCRSGYVCDNVLGTVVCVSQCHYASECPSRYCQDGFCCGSIGFKCCSSNGCPKSGTCNAAGYCN